MPNSFSVLTWGSSSWLLPALNFKVRTACMWETMLCACSLSICMLLCFCTVCEHARPPAANWLEQLSAACRGGNNACIKECITADGEKRERKRPTERKSKWEEKRLAVGGGWQNKLQVCADVLCFLVLIFRSVLRKKKCNIWQWISNYALVHCNWEGRNTNKVTFKHPSGADSDSHQAKILRMCPWFTPQKLSTVKPMIFLLLVYLKQHLSF